MRHQIIFYLSLFILPFMLTSCNHEDLAVYEESENYRNAADFVSNNYDLSLFHAGLEASGLLEELRGAGPFTVFAPTNEAFHNIGVARPSDFATMDKDSLRFMMQYHIVPKRIYREDIPDNTIDNFHENLAGKELNLGYRKYPSGSSRLVDYLFVNGAEAPRATQNTALANGVLHLIDKVLKYDESVHSVLESKPEFSRFTQLLKHFGEWDRLGDGGPWTIFAPTNEAFDSRGLTEEAIQQMDPSAYNKEMLIRPYTFRNHFFVSDMTIYGNLPSNPYGGTGVSTFSVVEGAEEYVSGVRTTYHDGTSTTGPFVTDIEPTGTSRDYIRFAAWGDPWLRDFKTENGVVHATQDVLVHPEDAIQ